MSRQKELLSKYNSKGIDVFYKDYEKLDFYLNFTKRTAMAVSKNLIEIFKTLEGVIKASYVDLIEAGLDSEQILSLKFLSDLNKDLFKNHYKENKISITSKNELLAYLKNEIGFEKRENFFVIYLDSANCIINDKELRSESLFKGTIDRSVVYPREVAEGILLYNTRDEFMKNPQNLITKCFRKKAKSVIFAHNHPSGNIKPSRSDIELTQSLKEVLSLIDIRLLDHIIVTPSSYYSFLEEGLIG